MRACRRGKEKGERTTSADDDGESDNVTVVRLTERFLCLKWQTITAAHLLESVCHLTLSFEVTVTCQWSHRRRLGG